MKGAISESAAAKFKAVQVLPVSVAILDSQGTIVRVNSRWKDSGRRNGLRLPMSGVGISYLDYCTGQLLADLTELLAGRLDLLTLVYPCHSPTRTQWFFLSGVPLSLEKRSGVALLHADLTSLLLPPLAATHKPRIDSDRTEIEAATNLDMIGPSVEHSVSEGLSSLLAAMLTHQDVLAQRGRTAAKDDANQIVARARLSQRQLEILGLLGEGKTNAEIARVLSRSPNTVKLHVSAILRQLNFKNRTQAAILASNLVKSSRP